MKKYLPLSALLVLGFACSDDPVNVVVRNLDGPTDVAFGCIGDMRLLDGETVINGAQPPGVCGQWLSGETPAGQDGLQAPDLFGFVLQQTRGTIAVVDTFAGVVADSDPFAPGRNSIPIGTLPVGLTSDQSGCFVMTANAGSCDLSALDVASAVSVVEPAAVQRISVTNAAGEVLQAKPRAIEAGQLPSSEVGVECGASPTGRVFVTFPECNLVAAVNASTGQVEAGVRLLEDGGAEITDGNVTCPTQCGSGSSGAGVVPTGMMIDAGVPDAGPMPPVDLDPGAPVAIHLSPDGNRMFIGSQNSPVLTIVDLDPGGLPAQLRTVILEGDVGISAIEATGTLSMGGAFDSLGQVGVDFDFAYAITTDGSIRVVDTVGLVECDTQVDPRYLRETTNIEVLACMAVGDVATPPRRAGARGPGIRLPSDAIPLDLEIVAVEGEGSGQASPLVMLGTFGFVTASDGNTFVINVDDDNYSDFEEPADPSKVWMTLAVPHQLRDFVTDRNFIQANTCANLSTEIFELPPRLDGDVGVGFSFNPPMSQEKQSLLPRLRRVECAVDDPSGDPSLQVRDSVSELSLAAPVLTREFAYPDLLRIRNEDWFISWEGSLSLDGPNVAIDGRPVRAGIMENNQGIATVTEAGSPFCGTGVEPFDVLQITGCDPSRGDEQCGIGETCLVHPNTPSNVLTGMCFPENQAESLTNTCRDILTSNRRFTIREVFAGQLILGERARVLRTTPVGGCESDEQCQDLAVEELRLDTDLHPIELAAEALESDYAWSCQSDDTRKPGVDKCVMTCDSSADCEDGLSCSGGVCVEGKLPPDVCTQAVQRYQLRAGEAFAVVGTVSGFIHNRVADPDTGECVADPDASPLLTGRIPIDAPACSGDGFTDLSPNPCLTTTTHVEEVTSFEPRGSVCVEQGEVLRSEEDVPAVRFSNPAFTLHLVNLFTTGDADCNGDGQGTLPAYSPVFEDYAAGFTISGGFVPHFVAARTYLSQFPVKIRRDPAGVLWVMDQGDDRDPRQLTRGRVLTIDPQNVAEGFAAGNPLL